MNTLRVALSSLGRALVREPRAALLGTGAVAFGVLATLFLGLVARGLGDVAARGLPRAEMVVELSDDLDGAHVADLQSRLGALAVVESVRKLEPAQAMERLRASLGAEATVLEGVEPDFLPGALEVTFRPGTAGSTAVSTLAERLERTTGVAHVAYLGDWVSRLGALVAAARAIVLCALALCGLGALWAVAAAARMRALARSEEIAVLALCGATDRFVRAPFVLEGLLVGLCGAALGLGLLRAVLHFVAPVVAAAPATALQGGFRLELSALLPPAQAVLGVILVSLLSALAASIGVRRHARV